MSKIYLNWKFIFSIAISCFSIAELQTANAVTVSTPIIVGKGASTGWQLDGSLSVLPPAPGNSNPRWLSSVLSRPADGLSHVMTTGPMDNPYQTQSWKKVTCVRSGNFCKDKTATTAVEPAFIKFPYSDVVDLWFMGIYRPNPTNANDPHLLAFVHEERVGNTGGVNDPGVTKIGLAWSSNNGDSWNYLGRIISTANEKIQHNIQGAPYIINGGYFYVYYNDSPGQTSVARALISDVIAAAANGSAGNIAGGGNQFWKKLTSSGYTVDATSNLQSSGINPNEVIHTQATQSANGKYYLLTTQLALTSTVNQPTFVKLYESAGAQPNYQWTSTAIGSDLNGYIANEAYSSQVHSSGYDGGYQYCSIVDSNGALAGQAQVGLKFFVYCQKEASLSDSKLTALYRWEVNLDPANSTKFSRQSTDFQTPLPGSVWAYQYGGSGPIYNMTYNSNGYYNGTDVYDRIYSDSMHPGAVEVPVLKWIAPKTGTVWIEGTARKSDLNCGDGVNASIVYSGGTLVPSFNENISMGDNLGVSHRIKQAVTAGQALFFVVGGRANNYCDSMMWDPSVTYE